MYKKKTDEMRRVKWVLGKYFYNENLIIATKLRIAGSDFFLSFDLLFLVSEYVIINPPKPSGYFIYHPV